MISLGSLRAALRRRLSPRGPWALALLGVGVLGLLLLLTLAGFRLARPGTLPGLEVAGEPVGGLDRTDLETAVGAIVEERTQRPITVALDVDEDREVASERSELGYTADAEESVRRAWSRGRQLNPFAALRDHLRALGGTVRVPLSERVDEDALEVWAQQVAAELDTDPVEGDIRLVGTDVTTVEPTPGARIDRDALVADARLVAASPGEQRIVASSEPVAPRTDADQVAEVAERARRAVSEGVRLHRGEAALELSPLQIAVLLSVEERETEDGVELELVADPAALSVDDDLIAELETEPVDASFEVDNGEVELIPAQEGFRFDRGTAASQALEVATADGDREAELEGVVAEPELTTEEAEELEIEERVATFTTHHACCQGRVQNIQRMADMVRGTVVRPGEEFSINGHVGQRTREKGFTGGGAILRGEFIEAIGGGVSQFATTFFNAAYEGGYEILQHKPHSYYISRYPVGREATLNWPNIDVRIRNDSPYGLLLHTRYTGTSITVDFYGKEWVEVESVTGPQRNVRPPPTRYEENEDLDPGEERVVQGGRHGFDVSYRRIRRFPDGSSDEQSWSHRYVPEPRIIERNSSDPDEDEDDEDEDTGDDDTGDEDDDGDE